MTLAITGSLFAQSPIQYPETRKDAVVDDYFGTKVADPYRWLEDDNAAETKAWVKAQNAVTHGYLDAIPQRAAIRARLEKLWNFEKVSLPFTVGGHAWFFSKNDGLQNQAVLYTAASPDAAPRALLDPNALSKAGTVALSGESVSWDDKYIAYGLSKAGSDWITWKVRDVATGKDLKDQVEWSKFSGAAWSRDGKGFYYSAFDAPKTGEALTGVNKNQKVYYHELGTDQKADRLVYARKDQPDWGFGADTSRDGRWLYLYQNEGTESKNRIFVQDLSEKGSKIEPFLNDFDASYTVLANDGDTFYVLTDNGAPRKRLVAIQRSKPDPKDWKVILPEDPGTAVLESAALVDGHFIAQWMTDAHQRLKIYGKDGAFQKEIALPGLGSVAFSGRREDRAIYYSYTSFADPGSIYRYDLRSGKQTLWRRPKLAFNPDDFETKQVFFPSKDGTKIPMFITAKKGLKLDGQNPTLLYGYGGFDISLTPGFSVSRLVWMEMGGVYAQANLRGGGEYGNAWHDAGRLQHKQNVFDDFIAAAEWLIANKYTCTPKLAIQGGSNGGLLIGACETQRPDLFGVCLPQVGVMDMLRFHKFTIGWAWKSDYGSSETKEGFETLIKYSPLQNLKPGTSYPPTLIFTGDHDDRVVPAHSFKYAATIQADQAGPAPVLIRIETDAGHGAGKPTSKSLDELADAWAFCVKNLDITVPEGFGK
ncbi:MAG: S9 family peptidase [Acidobacteria bacterium]|nr:S9 family peptidase [Acidobacteriota bacterium]